MSKSDRRSSDRAHRQRLRRTSRKRSRVNALRSPGPRSDTAVHKASLSPPRRRFLELLQSINFGYIENLVIKDGEPVLDPRPTYYGQIKFCGENGPRPELDTFDGYLKEKHIELYALFDELQNGTIALLDVQNGLPFCATLQGSNA